MRFSFVTLVLGVLYGSVAIGLARADSYLPLIGKDGTPPTATQTSIQIPTVTRTPTLIPTAPTVTFTPTNTPIPTHTAGPSPTPTTTPPNSVTVRGNNDFVPYPDRNVVFIVGEVVNQTGQNAGRVRVNAILRDLAGNYIDNTEAFPHFAELLPQMVSPFGLAFFVDPSSYGSYDLSVTWTNATYPPVILEVSQAESYFNDSDTFHAKGLVRNQTDATREFIKVAVTMYDGSGKVIGNTSGLSDPDSLTPGQVATFDLGIETWKGKPDRSQVASYTILAADN